MSGIPARADPAVVETHTAVLCFIGDRVIKAKKAVRLPFVDFSSRPARLASCHREVELNRRLSPDVYLGVATVDFEGRPAGEGEPVVVMRRMPDDRRLSTLVRSGADVDSDLDALARLVADFHAHAARGPEIDDVATAAAIRELWVGNLAGVRQAAPDVLDADLVEEVATLGLGYVAGRAVLFAERIAAGQIVDGHGDLLADDIFCLDDGPRVLDCLEFDDALRFGDVVADVAFLAMDLERLGAGASAQRFLDSYRGLSGVTWPDSLADHYIASRALVRAKVDCIRAGQGDPAAATRARAALLLAATHLRRGHVRLVLVGGAPGTGKTTLAGGLAAELGWVVLSSDETRKELAGPAAGHAAREGFRAGLYEPSMTERTYRALLQRARVALERGQSVVLDATWADERWRREAAGVASGTDSELIAFECRAPSTVTTARIERRLAGPAQPSDATPAIAVRLAAAFDPWPAARPIDTSRDPDAVLAEVLTELAAAGSPRPVHKRDFWP
jgi:aminoglycoside phosphotransferase family enzyme/predicted kinase